MSGIHLLSDSNKMFATAIERTTTTGKYSQPKREESAIEHSSVDVLVDETWCKYYVMSEQSMQPFRQGSENKLVHGSEAGPNLLRWPDPEKFYQQRFISLAAKLWPPS